MPNICIANLRNWPGQASIHGQMSLLLFTYVSIVGLDVLRHDLTAQILCTTHSGSCDKLCCLSTTAADTGGAATDDLTTNTTKAGGIKRKRTHTALSLSLLFPHSLFLLLMCLCVDDALSLPLPLHAKETFFCGTKKRRPTQGKREGYARNCKRKRPRTNASNQRLLWAVSVRACSI